MGLFFFHPVDTLTMSCTEDIANIRQFGVGIIETISGLIFESVLYGAYAVLVVFAVRTLVRKRYPKISVPTLMMIFSTVVMFSMSTTLFAIDIYDILRPLEVVLVWTDRGESVAERQSTYNLGVNSRVFAQTVVYTFEFLLGDSVVVWRACALWAFDWKVLFAPLLMLTAATVMSFFFVGCIVHNNMDFIFGEPAVCNHAQFSTFFLSLATNALATGLIAYKAWQHRKIISATHKKRTQSEKIMLLLIESGLLYFLIWGAKSFTYFPIVSQGSIHFAAQILNNMGNQIVGLYPTIIIVLVHLQYTVWDISETFGPSSGNRTTASTPSTKMVSRIMFAHSSDVTSTTAGVTSAGTAMSFDPNVRDGEGQSKILEVV